MIKYRVYTANGWSDFGDFRPAEDYHATDGVGEIETINIEPQPWNKRQWELDIVEPGVRAHIEAAIRPEPLDYISIHEPNTWVGDQEYSEEALAVRAWIRACWRSVRQQIEPLTEPVEVEVIIDNLPDLNLP